MDPTREIDYTPNFHTIFANKAITPSHSTEPIISSPVINHQDQQQINTATINNHQHHNTNDLEQPQPTPPMVSLCDDINCPEARPDWNNGPPTYTRQVASVPIVPTQQQSYRHIGTSQSYGRVQLQTPLQQQQPQQRLPQPAHINPTMLSHLLAPCQQQQQQIPTSQINLAPQNFQPFNNNMQTQTTMQTQSTMSPQPSLAVTNLSFNMSQPLQRQQTYQPCQQQQQQQQQSYQTQPQQTQYYQNPRFAIRTHLAYVPPPPIQLPNLNDGRYSEIRFTPVRVQRAKRSNPTVTTQRRTQAPQPTAPPISIQTVVPNDLIVEQRGGHTANHIVTSIANNSPAIVASPPTTTPITPVAATNACRNANTNNTNTNQQTPPVSVSSTTRLTSDQSPQTGDTTQQTVPEKCNKACQVEIRPVMVSRFMSATIQMEDKDCQTDFEPEKVKEVKMFVDRCTSPILSPMQLRFKTTPKRRKVESSPKDKSEKNSDEDEINVIE